MVRWSVTFKEYDGSLQTYSAPSKLKAVRFYLNEMSVSDEVQRSEYKIWKNNTDYTATLNRFLER